MSAAQRAKTAWKVFSAVGTAVTGVYQYNQGLQGKPVDWGDTGPQVLPKLAGRVHHTHNEYKQMEGRWEDARVRASYGLPPKPLNERQ